MVIKNMDSSRRKKKINVLHMLGAWEGKLDDCNCRGCKEAELEEKLYKAPIKIDKNTTKVKKVTKPKKFKSIILCLDSGDENIGESSTSYEGVVSRHIETIDSEENAVVISEQVIEDGENNLNKANTEIDMDKVDLVISTIGENSQTSDSIIVNEFEVEPTNSELENRLGKSKKRGRPRKEKSYILPVSCKDGVSLKPDPDSIEDELLNEDKRPCPNDFYKNLENIKEEIFQEDDNSVFNDDVDDFDFPMAENVENTSKRNLKKNDIPSDGYIECNICFKMLKETSMKQHYKTHSGDKPHPCNECSRRFTRRGDVQRHKRIVHQKERPYQCSQCDKFFVNKQVLKVHVENHGKIAYYSCHKCEFKFGKKEYYENHIRYIHPLPAGMLPQKPKYSDDSNTEVSNHNQNDDSKNKEKNNTPNSDIPLQKGQHFESTNTNNTQIMRGNTEDNLQLNIKVEQDVEEVEIPINPFELDLKSTISSTNAFNKTSKYPKVTNPLMKLSKGTLSLTHTMPNGHYQDEELVNKAINAAVSQATYVLEGMQTFTSNMSSKSSNIDDNQEDDENDEEIIPNNLNMIYETDTTPLATPAEKQNGINRVTSNSPKEDNSRGTEVHVTALVSGQPQKFIIKMPSGNNFNIHTQEGMEMIINMINQLTAGKGEINGPVEVVMHNGPNSSD